MLEAAATADHRPSAEHWSRRPVQTFGGLTLQPPHANRDKWAIRYRYALASPLRRRRRPPLAPRSGVGDVAGRKRVYRGPRPACYRGTGQLSGRP